MHNTKLLLILLSTHAYAHAHIAGNNQTIPTNSNCNPNIYGSVHHSKFKPQYITNITSTITAIDVRIRDIAISIMEKAQKTFTKDNYNKAKEALKIVLWEYRYKIAASTLLTAYAITNILLAHDYYYLQDTHCWSHWKSDCNFELLCARPHQELTQELIRSIGECHYNKKNPADASHPLIIFIANIETEIKLCKRYIATAKMIKQAHLMKIFPVNDAKIEQVNQFLERCLFIKHLFLSWLTERNLINKARKTISLPLPQS